MDFVALDFETANSRADSACQLAVVFVEAGEIVDEACWLIRPPRLYFSPRNIAVHGIRPEHVERADSMARVWSELQPRLDGKVLIAHNARFDVGVLVASLAAYDVACPSFEFSCTRALAKYTWPHQPRYGLAPLGAWLGITFKHHDALEDARCCAQIAIRAAQHLSAKDLATLEQQLRITRGKYSLGRIAGPRAVGGRSRSSSRSQLAIAEGRSSYSVPSSGVRRGSLNSTALVQASGGEKPFAGRRIVFLGCLKGLSQQQTIDVAEALGATCDAHITTQTDYVVACGGTLIADAAKVVADAAAERAASPTVVPPSDVTERPTASRAIRVLSERQFLALVPGGKASVQW